MEKIEVVKSFVLLGSTIERNGDCKVEITCIITLGRAAMTELNKIWKNRDTSDVKSKSGNGSGISSNNIWL